MSDQPLATTGQSSSKKPETVKQWLSLDSTKSELGKALPKHLTPDRFVRVAMTALAVNPKLQNCTMESVVMCLLKCAQYGIEPDGRRAHLIPYKDQCTLIFDYKGLAELVRRSGDVSYIHADVVREKDEFEYLFGTGAVLRHKPVLKDRGEIICAYSFVKLKDGSEDFDIMALDDVDTVRDRSQNYQNAKRNNYKTPWDTDYAEMAKKTVFRRHSKWLPLSPDVRGAVEDDDEALTETERFEVAKPAKPIFQKKRSHEAAPDGPDKPEGDDPASDGAPSAANRSSADPERPAASGPLSDEEKLAIQQFEEIKASVEHAGWTEEVFIHACADLGLAPKSAKTYDTLAESRYGQILADWSKIKANVETSKPKAA